MSFFKISRQSSSKLTVEFPTHKTQYDIREGPITVVILGLTSTIDITPQPLRIDLPKNRSVIEIYDAEKKLICSWESIAPTEDGDRSAAPKMEDTDSDDCTILFSRKTKRPQFRYPLTPESSTTKSARASETPQASWSSAEQYKLKRPASFTPHESPTRIISKPENGLPAQIPDSTPGASISERRPPPTSRGRRTWGIKVPRSRVTRREQPPPKKNPRSDDSTYAPHAPSRHKETQSAPSRRQPEHPKPASSHTQHSPLPNVPNPDQTLTIYQIRFLTKLLRHISKDIHAAEFLRPVDPITNPTYPTLVSTPIDLRTISQNLKSGRYKTLSALIADIDLLVHNAETFNGPDSEIFQDAVILRNIFNAYIANFPGPDIDTMEAVNLLFTQGPTGSEDVTGNGEKRSVRGTKRAAIDYSMENYFSKRLRLD